MEKIELPWDYISHLAHTRIMAIVPSREEIYRYIDGRDYDFGIKRLIPVEQKELLRRAASMSPPITKASMPLPSDEDYAFTPHNKPRTGFCKSANCAKRFVPAATHMGVNYNCEDCLARHLCDLRRQASLLDITVFFEGTGGRRAFPDEKLNVMLEMGNCLINRKIVSAYFDDLDNSHQLIVPVPFELNGKLLSGRFNAVLCGKNVCKSLYLGETCWSLDKSYKPHGFMASTIPPGVPGWHEISKPPREGLIMIADYCPACANRDKVANAERQKFNHTPLPSPSRGREETPSKDDIIKDLQQQIVSLSGLYVQERKMVDTLRYKVSCLEDEIADLRRRC